MSILYKTFHRSNLNLEQQSRIVLLKKLYLLSLKLIISRVLNVLSLRLLRVPIQKSMDTSMLLTVNMFLELFCFQWQWRRI